MKWSHARFFELALLENNHGLKINVPKIAYGNPETSSSFRMGNLINEKKKIVFLKRSTKWSCYFAPIQTCL